MKIFQVRRGVPGNAVLLVSGLLWWIVLAPVARLMPRRRSLAMVYGRDGGKFTDNCKHLFCSAVASGTDIDFIYIAKDADTARKIREHAGRAVVRGGLAEFRLWLRSGTVFVDSVDWTDGYRFAASHGARIVQMWHGIPLKLVQMARVRGRKRRPPPLEWAYQLYLRSTGRTRPLDWFVSTSRFVTEQAFRTSFPFHDVSHAGYPRNDALFDRTNLLRRMNVDARASRQIEVHRERGARVCVYAPTFRNALSDPFADGSVDLHALSEAMQRLNILMLIKLHPWMHGRLVSTDLPGLVFVAPESDLYPLLPQMDFLITDYSSVFFDFLLLDRPVLFFPYDLERYLADERPMYFDYEEMTPGPKARSVSALVEVIERVAGGQDDWREARAHVRDRVFDHQDGQAGSRLLAELFPRSPSHPTAS